MRPSEESSPRAERLAPIIHELHPSTIRELEDARVAALAPFTKVLVVPVREKHHENFQTLHFVCAFIRRIDPTPRADKLRSRLDLFKRSPGEATVRVDESRGPLQNRYSLNSALREEMGGLPVIAERRHEAGDECFGLHVQAAFQTPLDSSGVA